MTSPRRDKWLFDENMLCYHIQNPEPPERLKLFINKSIKRNVREFAEKLRYQEFDYDHERFNQRINAAIKELDA